MPLPLLALGAAAAGAAGLGQAIYGAVAPNPAARRNREQLDRLLELERKGQLGLSGTEQRLLYQQQADPVRNYAAQQRANYERVAAASGDQSGAELARLRQEQGRMVGRASQDAALNTAAANEARRQQQLREIDQRTAARTAYGQQRASTVFGGLAQAGGALGQLAGSPAGTLSPLTENMGAYLRNLQRTDPEAYNELMRRAVAGMTGGAPATGGTGG